MALVTSVTSQITFKDSSGFSILPAWVNNLLADTTVFASRPEIFVFGATTTPVAFTINNIAGASPVSILVINTAAADATVLGVASFTQLVYAPANGIPFAFMPAFVTTSNITLSVASGTGDIVVVILK